MECPVCGSTNLEGSTQCVNCGRQLVLASSDAGSEERLSFSCPRCGRALSAPPDWAGQQGACPSCGAEVQAPPATASAGAAVAASPSPPAAQVVVGAPEAVAAAPRRAADAPRRRRWRGVVGGATNVSMALTLVMGVVLTAVALAILHVTDKGYVHKLLTQRGPVPYAIVFITAWAFSILLLKWFRIRRQEKSLAQDWGQTVAPGLAAEASSETVDRTIADIENTDQERGGTLLARRLLLGVERWRSTRNLAEVDEAMRHQADLDADTVDSSYAAVRLFIWCAPILGFIGTVIGIGSAVAGFSGMLREAAKLEEIKAGLSTVTSGLGVAFDTTLVGLAAALLIMLVTTAMQHREESMLAAVTEDSRAWVIGQIQPAEIVTAGASQQGQAALDEAALDRVLSRYLPNIEVWRAAVEAMAKQLHAAVVSTAAHMRQDIGELNRRTTAEMNGVVESFVDGGKKVQALLSQSATELGEKLASQGAEQSDRLQQTAATFAGSLEKHSGDVASHVAALRELSAKAESLNALQQQLVGTLDAWEKTGQLTRTLSGLQQTLERIQPTLDALSRPKVLRLVDADSPERPA